MVKIKLFTENITLKSINEVLVKQIPKYSLLGDIPLSYNDFLYLASKIKLFYDEDYSQQVNIMYKESLAVFLVFCAVFEYNDRTFWKPVENYVGTISNNQRIKTFKAFSDVIQKYNLNLFENESIEGFTYVTPILCHAGIPINAYDSYFEAISNTINDTFYDDFTVEDYLIYLQNKSEITIKRYIRQLNKKNAYNFIQDSRNIMLNDSLEKDEMMEYGNFIRMSEQVSLWKEKPKIKKTLNARNNIQLCAPKIKMDLNGIGIFCEIPRIVLKDCYDSYIVWEILSKDSTNLVKANILRRSGLLVSEEKIVVLHPTESIMVSLKVDDNLISKWEFELIKENHMAFMQNGNIIKTDSLPNNLVLLLLNQNTDIVDKEELSITELPKIPLWNEYNVYQIDLTNSKVLKCANYSINVNSETKPKIVGGETLFNQESSNSYTILPYIKVPIFNDGDWHIEIKHKTKDVLISKANTVVECGCECIMLKSLITKGYYGNYDIKIWHRMGIDMRFNIEYVPFSAIEIMDNQYWPSNYQGYKKNIQSIKTTKGVELEIFNAEKVSEINYDSYIVCKYKVEENDRFLFGEYKYKFREYAFASSIKKSIHPVSWGIVGIENEIIELSSKVYTLTLKDLDSVSDPYLLFSFDYERKYDINYLKFDLVGADKEIVKSDSISIQNKDRLRIPLNAYIFEFQSYTEVDYNLRVSLIDSNDMFVSTFLVARVQDEVVIECAKCSENENNIFITWNEMGTKNGRECVLINFLKPWQKSHHIKIEDKSCEISINKEILEAGYYKYAIQKENDDLFNEESEDDLCSINGLQKGIIVIMGEAYFSTDIEKILYNLLKSRFVKKEVVIDKLRKIEKEANNIKEIEPEDIGFLSYTYILIDRFFTKKEDYNDVDKLLDFLFDMVSILGKQTIKYVLNSKFSHKYKNELMHKLYCNNLTTRTEFNNIEKKTIMDIDENMAGFINLLQLENNTKGLSWAGISDIEVLLEDDLFVEADSKPTFLSDENLGKSGNIIKYYEYVYNCIQRTKNNSKSTEDFIREFEKEQSLKETKVFGKTRIHTLVDWRNNNKLADDIQEKLSQIMKIHCEEHIKANFSDAFIAISKREADDEIGYYIGLVALYASFIRNGIMDDSKDFNRLLHYAIDNCEKLYYRDAILIELYMHKERGLSWG